MSELYFLRHGERIDHAKIGTTALTRDYQAYDPSISNHAISQIKQVVNDIISITTAFPKTIIQQTKTVFIHFSPYLRCCQTADLLVTHLREKFDQDPQFSKYSVKFQLLGDFALSEWIHDKMTNQPPFIDSDDAYSMYTPNIKQLVNKSCCSNFRPATKLGGYNGPNLKYRDYQRHCKEYFSKLLATYDKSMYIKNQDIVIVVSHGYAINNFMTFFMNHPIFQEIPEAKINVAKRILQDDKQEDGSYKPENYTWVLVKDSLDLVEEHIEYPLNLQSNVVYYKTNFIPRDKLNWDGSEPELLVHRAPVKRASDSDILLCPAAKDWKPGAKLYKIRKDFHEKYMDDNAFKRNFNLTNPPTRRVTPEVSPQSAPSRGNSLIDLRKLLTLEKLTKPLKLKYGSSHDIPSSELNSKVNSQVNLMDYATSSGYISGVSSNSSMDKLLLKSKFVMEDSYFPQMKCPLQNSLPEVVIDDMERKISTRPRSESYNKQRIMSQPSSDSNDEFNEDRKYFSLEFSPSRSPQREQEQQQQQHTSYTSSPRKTRSRKNSIKFIPSGVTENPNEQPMGKIKPIFYYFDSNNTDEDEEMDYEESTNSSSNTNNKNQSGQIFWLGQNR